MVGRNRTVADGFPQPSANCCQTFPRMAGEEANLSCKVLEVIVTALLGDSIPPASAQTRQGHEGPQQDSICPL